MMIERNLTLFFYISFLNELPRFASELCDCCLERQNEREKRTIIWVLCNGLNRQNIGTYWMAIVT